MPQKKKILLVNNNEEERKELLGHLDRAGYQIVEVKDGALAINKAIIELPDMVITIADMPLVNGFKLCQLLRTNPATQQIPFIFITDKETNPKKLGQFIRPDDDFIIKPFKIEELLGRINNLFYRIGKVQEVSGEVDRSVAGTLTEIALVDLLQIFKMNNKNGILTLKTDGQSGSIFIRDGVVINARIGKVGGQKAIFRLITWQHGTFEFKPGVTETGVKIQQPTENLIMEGLRQLDELNRLKDRLPAKKAALRVKKSFKGPDSKLRPVTREVLKLLEYFSRVEDILDNSNYPDLEVYSTLQTLIKHEVIEIKGEREEDAAGVRKPLLSLEEALKIGYYLGVGKGDPNQTWIGKVLIFAKNSDYLERFLDKAEAFPEVHLEPHEASNGQTDMDAIGIKASLTIMDKITLLLLNLPPQREYEPLWHTFHHRAIGALILGDGDQEGENIFLPVSDFLKETKVPFAAVSLSGEEGPEDQQDGSGHFPWIVINLDEADFARRTLRVLFDTILAG